MPPRDHLAAPTRRRTPRRLCAAALCLTAAATPSASRAQRLVAAVVDSAAHLPVVNVLVALERVPDSAFVAEGLTNGDGMRALLAPSAGAYRVVVRRVGYRPERFGPYSLAAAQTLAVTLPVAGRRVELPAVTIVGREPACEVITAARPDGAAGVLVDAMRTALDVSAQDSASGGSPREVRTFTWPVDLAGREGRVRYTPWVRAPGTRVFEGGAPAGRYVTGRLGVDDRWYGPDERSFLDAAFLATHCFVSARSDDGGGPLIGLRFEPVDGAMLPNVGGVLWFERATLAPRAVDFRFVGVDYTTIAGPTPFAGRPPTKVSARGAYDRIPGGRLELAPTDDGRWVVARWLIRTPTIRDYAYSGRAVVGLTAVGAEARAVTAGAK